MTPKEQTPDAQPSESAHEDRLFNEWTGEVPPTSETTYEELLGHLQIVIRELEMIYDEHQGTLNNALLNPNSILSLAKSAISRAATRYERAKQAELVEENERLKSQLKDYCNDCQHPAVNERQAAELSKLRQENEAKRSDLTDKLEEAVHHMDNGHTAQATTLIYEVIGELEPKGE